MADAAKSASDRETPRCVRLHDPRRGRVEQLQAAPAFGEAFVHRGPHDLEAPDHLVQQLVLGQPEELRLVGKGEATQRQ